MKLQDKLIELRKEKNWSQEDLAEKLDVSRQAISRWENGTALPDAQNILRISKLFDVTADYLLNDDHEGDMLASADETQTEEVNPPIKKEKPLYLYLIPAICIITLIACVIITVITLNKEPPHPVLNSVRENEIAPTCAAEGSYDEVIYCAECDEEICRTTKSIAKLAHTLSESVTENEIAPTCTAEGSYDEVVYCQECDEELLRTHRSTEMISHKYQNRKCVACGKAQPSEGLLYMSNGDGTCCVDIGDCTDENIVIPDYSPSGDRVTKIRTRAFAGHNNLISVQIPETVQVIGEGAFEQCKNLESVNLPSKITIIYSYTFSGCEKLKGVEIPAGVYHIGEEAFADCVSFESIVIPASVTKIGAFAFRDFSDCDGAIIFEIYDGWELHDPTGAFVDIVDFSNGIPADPVMYIALMYSEYVWIRHQ
ncbi:MAG: leucine-rich repeat protein [Clostridia bacterium]|nr:leucine-rich repeat protein [Clostridia bacterium]